MPATNRRALLVFFWAAVCVVSVPRAAASAGRSAWMHALVGVPLPSYDEKTDAVLLYSETNVTVLSEDEIRKHVRRAYKILRPGGREHDTVGISFNPGRKIKSMHGWCIPAQGKDYEVKDKDALDVSAPIEGGELVSDVKYRVLRIPAPDPGNIIGYEYEVEEQPFWLAGHLAFPGNRSGAREPFFVATSFRLGVQDLVAFLSRGETHRSGSQRIAVGSERGERDPP